MKRILSLLLALAAALTLLPAGAFAATGVTVDAATFPDAAFRAWVLDRANLGGAGADGLLTAGELAGVREMDLTGLGIADLTGIGHFTALESLTVTGNQLQSLDVSANTALTALYCSNNQLTSLTLGSLPGLQYLYCASNRLTALDVTGCPALLSLNCERNQLTGLDLSGNPALMNLYCRHNALTSLDVRHNTELVFIETFDNQLTSFDCSMLSKLEFLHIDYNQLTTLDMSHNPNLKGNGFVAANNQLESLTLPNIPGFTVEAEVFLEQNPRTGYDRVEWFADSGFTRPVTGSTLTADGQTLFARWAPNPYTVYYRPGGGAGSMEPQAVVYDQTFSLASNAFTRTGYTFAGWSTHSDGLGGQSFADGEQVRNLAGSHSADRAVYLYAQWAPNAYTIRYDLGEGAGTAKDQSAVYDQPVTLAAGEFTRQDAVFVGWALSAGGERAFFPGAQAVNLTAEPGGVVTLYAVWKSYADIQKVYQDELQELYGSYSRNDYYSEDWDQIETSRTAAANAIAAANADETVMGQALRVAVAAMEAAPTKADRARQIADAWEQAHGGALSGPVAMDQLADRANRAEAARAGAETAALASLSGLTAQSDREAAAQAALALLAEPLARLDQLDSALAWLERAAPLYDKAMAQVTSGSVSDYDTLAAGWEGLAPEARAYCDPAASAGVLARQALAREKQQALEELTDLRNSLKEGDYAPEAWQRLAELAAAAAAEIEAADAPGLPAALLVAGKASLEQVEPLVRTPAILVPPTASAITRGQALTASTLAGGRAEVPGTFAWKEPEARPQATGEQTVVFTPADSRRYATVELAVTVTVTEPAPAPTASPAPTAAPTARPTAKPAAPTAAPTQAPVPAATPAPTTRPLAGGGAKPTATPAPTAQATATPAPTATATPAVTPDPTPDAPAAQEPSAPAAPALPLPLLIAGGAALAALAVLLALRAGRREP